MQAASSGPAVAARAPASFAVSYGNPPALAGAFWYAWQTMLVVLLVLVGGPLWVWRVSGGSGSRAPAVCTHAAPPEVKAA